MRAAIVSAALLMLGMSAAQAAPTQQFDLVCAGTVKRNGGPPTPEQRRYRIDLKANRFCLDECEHAGALKSVTPDMITISEPAPGDVLRVSQWVSRQDGTYGASMVSPYLSTQSEGHCDVAAFSGLPKPKF